jgi:hypothetical protein
MQGAGMGTIKMAVTAAVDKGLRNSNVRAVVFELSTGVGTVKKKDK